MEEGNGRTGAGTAERVRDNVRELEDRLEGLREYAESADSWIRNFARERPLLAIGCAIGLGFVIGRIASKS